MAYDDLGDRMKRAYENAYKYVLPSRMPVILRVDGKAFHKFTEGMSRPFTAQLITAMDEVATTLCQEIDGAQLAYVQSDEVSVLIHNYKKYDSMSWFSNEVQKMASVGAGIAASVITLAFKRRAAFDGRVFAVPESDVANYFLWRQQDATRNSLSMVARSLYTHDECVDKDSAALQEMCSQKGVVWNDLPTYLKLGRCAVRLPFSRNGVIRHSWEIDTCVPVFSQKRDYIEKHLAIEEG